MSAGSASSFLGLPLPAEMTLHAARELTDSLTMAFRFMVSKHDLSGGEVMSHP